MSKDRFEGEAEFFRKFEQLMNDDKMREAIKQQAQDDGNKWKPITKTMGMFKREERGIYTDEGTPGLFYFKATHWRYLK